jgi:hypothetical protein
MAKACRVGGLWQMVDRDEKRLKKWNLTDDMFNRWEDNTETVAQVAKYARILAEL